MAPKTVLIRMVNSLYNETIFMLPFCLLESSVHDKNLNTLIPTNLANDFLYIFRKSWSVILNVYLSVVHKNISVLSVNGNNYSELLASLPLCIKIGLYIKYGKHHDTAERKKWRFWTKFLWWSKSNYFQDMIPIRNTT